jgi:hypothetical protein
VAGVHTLLRQHNSLVPFLQTVPSEARQLSLLAAWAKAAMGTASAADAKSTATLFSFFMFLLSRNAAVTCETFKSEAHCAGHCPTTRRVFTPTNLLCHRGSGQKPEST